ncbi:MAG: hypothetical protein ACTILZ_07485 [Leuconostoc mesenteroides]|uniref:Uncharacterized protein n=2 Tax=Leuconostoc carnosum TaxID=1252 RepID=K0DBN1_LEUCJ|nr:hypothetical protein [Leuconostoc carnosum]AFT80972.1 hypothetical protein C270_00265 [Leuconostoc carnosum JB16]KAA8332338.1 hypothetical protein FE409_00205 [Leuconostoc carnosum]KAA8371390.1 hypothetical protein FE414_00165 [Leuconostoc carnosum]KAA8383111.1 hypothetical protein FE410_00165 [Leuconostoc carnosum]QEA33463.1 hypothetical protein FGL89_04600 [Leuconostoc carnosum]
MAEEKMNIDPNEFAMALVSNAQQAEDISNQKFIKTQLTLYLEAYYMIEDFNHLEVNQVENMKQQQMSDLFDKMLSGRFTP